MRYNEFLREICPPLDLEWRKYRRRAARHRVEARLHELGLPDYAAYLQYLRATPHEMEALPDRMRVTVSRFFRERGRWDLLADQVLPQLLQRKPPHEPLRIWSAGCCGGEEPYTLALLWLDRLQKRFANHRIEILATDIDLPSLERARQALYESGSLREVPPELRRAFFEPAGHRWQLVGSITSMVRFTQHNLLLEPPPKDMDLVCCRYLAFTYYCGERRLQAARRLCQALRPQGALMIARKEDLGSASALFTPWPGAAGIFRKTASAAEILNPSTASLPPARRGE